MTMNTKSTTWVVEMEVGTFETANYEEARAWNRDHPGSSLDRADNR